MFDNGTTIDLLLMELVHAILWFNPIMIFYKRAIKIQHEYLADFNAIQNEDDLQPYLECMLNQIQVENFSGPDQSILFSHHKKPNHYDDQEQNLSKIFCSLFFGSSCCMPFAVFIFKTVTSRLDG